jgi:cysteinyl-tRNA synthetase
MVSQDVRRGGWTDGLREVRAGILRRLTVLGIEPEFATPVLPADLGELLEERDSARRLRDWKRADEIRAIFRERGWSIEDTPRGQSVRKA